jgi:hypothetical protein
MVIQQNFAALLYFSFYVVLGADVHVRYEMHLHWAKHCNCSHSRFVWNTAQWTKRPKAAAVCLALSRMLRVYNDVS